MLILSTLSVMLVKRCFNYNTQFSIRKLSKGLSNSRKLITAYFEILLLRGLVRVQCSVQLLIVRYTAPYATRIMGVKDLRKEECSLSFSLLPHKALSL